jgi:hypothetical protein
LPSALLSGLGERQPLCQACGAIWASGIDVYQTAVASDNFAVESA